MLIQCGSWVGSPSEDHGIILIRRSTWSWLMSPETDSCIYTVYIICLIINPVFALCIKLLGEPRCVSFRKCDENLQKTMMWRCQLNLFSCHWWTIIILREEDGTVIVIIRRDCGWLEQEETKILSWQKHCLTISHDNVINDTGKVYWRRASPLAMYEYREILVLFTFIIIIFSVFIGYYW